MDLKGQAEIPADRQAVWDGLNNPDILKACIPGCQSLEKEGDDRFTARVQVKVGPVQAVFNGVVTLSELNPPESYRISGEGKGGAAGFAKGGARVTLEDLGDATTRLTYEADASVGGKLAQLGARLVQGTAKKYADDFFQRFARQIAPERVEAATDAGEVPAPDITRVAPSPPSPPVSAPAAEPTIAGAPQTEAAAPVAPVASDASAPAPEPKAPEPEAPTHATAPEEQAPPGGLETRGGTNPLLWLGGAVVVILLITLLVTLT